MTNGAVDVRRLATGQVRLRCTDGSVQLHHPSRTVALTAHQQIEYDRGQLGEIGQLTSDDAGWRQGVVVFDNLKDRKSVVYGKSVSVRVVIGGCRINHKNKINTK